MPQYLATCSGFPLHMAGTENLINRRLDSRWSIHTRASSVTTAFVLLSLLLMI
jgi:hypothetical protein